MKFVPKLILSLFFFTWKVTNVEANMNSSENPTELLSFSDIELSDENATFYADTITVSRPKSQNYEDVQITQELYERLVYFSKMCALTYCIGSNELLVGSTLLDGACPERLKFCSDESTNPTAGKTVVELVLLAESDELGTGFLAVDHEKHVVVLSFRGSSTNQDWLSDFAVYPTPYEPVSKEFYKEWVESGRVSDCTGCLVHRGFNVFLKTLSSQFFERIEAIFDTYPDYSLVVTGHSLGAAVASLAGIELRLRGHDPLVLTYASPNIFNNKLRAWVDELFETERIHKWSLDEGKVMFRKGYFRVVHDGDYITMVPPFYGPAGLEIFINQQQLPQTLEDLEYHGPSMTAAPLQNSEACSPMGAAGRGQGHWFLGPLEKWLHMYEHRAYFLLINTCDRF
ncbi:LAFA_0E19240g1_1 [Lachancea sp. 'fantastica']|nr:LAFA_0E19240g1_1 [Lachancea sp. 'fantastica']